MKKNIFKIKYEGQALAIVMVVLVVSALIGLSIYSRSMKDRMLTLEERASAEALEVSDVSLEQLTLLSIEEVVQAFEETFAQEGEPNLEEGIVLTENDDKGQMTSLLRSLGVIEATHTISDLLSPICPANEGGNEYQLTLKIADENTFYEVRPGHIWSLPAREILRSKTDCVLNMNFAIRGDTRAGFIVSRVYCDYDENGIAINCKEYEPGDFDKYCFSDNGLECNNVEGFYDQGGGSNWQPFNPEQDSLDPVVMSGGDAPSEIRIKAVGGTIGISYSLPEGCMDGLNMYQLRATANCQGVYRGKEILIPEKKWHETIFDYVIFNNEGTM
jgi:hypothetical protein